MHSFDKVPNWAFDEYSFTLVIGGESSSINKIYMETSVVCDLFLCSSYCLKDHFDFCNIVVVVVHITTG